VQQDEPGMDDLELSAFGWPIPAYVVGTHHQPVAPPEGIRRSINTTSGRCVVAGATTSSPSCATPTSSTPGRWPSTIARLAGLGSGFEVASIGELNMLQQIGVDAADVLYSNPIKPPSHIAAAHRAGLWRFSFDSEGELYKLAQHAPGSAPRDRACQRRGRRHAGGGRPRHLAAGP